MKVTYYYAVRYFCHPLKMWEGGREVMEGWCGVFVRVSCLERGYVTLENYMEIDF